MTASDVVKDLQRLANPEKAKLLQGFFKTGKGQYAEGDIFLGITVPEQRKVARKYVSIDLQELQKLIASPIHEHRLTALEILTMKYEKATKFERSAKEEGKVKKDNDKNQIVAFYLKSMKYVNNWDLVDASASYILGESLIDKKDRAILYSLAKSKVLWERRIAIVASGVFIRVNDFADTLRLALILIDDDHDLIHKASGWMLREVGKRSEKTLDDFLIKNVVRMPRTMLRYAIERMPEAKRKTFLSMKSERN